MVDKGFLRFMSDIVDRVTRSRMMSGIRGKNTRPEILLRHALHRLGYRYRLHGKLPGKPDLVFPSRRAVIFVNGCFWHGHDCHLFKWPSSRPEFWRTKISGNRQRDSRSSATLHELGWRILTVWECAVKGKRKWDEKILVTAVACWLDSAVEDTELRGHNHDDGRSDQVDE